MKLHFLLLVCFNILWVQCTETTLKAETDEIDEKEGNAGNIVEEVKKREPFYPHRIGIMNPRHNCYMNAVFSSLYDIPFFQDTVYRIIEELPDITELLEVFDLPEHVPSTLISLADIFVKMRTGNQAVKLDKTMFPAIQQSMEWRLGDYQCVLEFWGSFVETMPERFKELFQVKVSTNYIRKSDNRLIKSIPDVYNYINIPIPSQPIAISSIISNQFLDEEVEDYTVLPSEQKEYGDLFSEPLIEKLSIPVKSTVTFTNKPNVLVFGVKRLNYNAQSGKYELNEVPVMFDHVNLDGEAYVPVASVIFNNEHYYAIVTDISFGDFFLHNDLKVHYMDVKNNPQYALAWTKILRRKSVLVFYAKVSGLLTFKGDKFVAIKSNKDIPACLLNLQRKTEVAKVLSPEGGNKRKPQKRKSNVSPASFYKSKKRKSNMKLKAIESTEPAIAERSETVQDEKVEEENSEVESSSSSSEAETELANESSRSKSVSVEHQTITEADKESTEKLKQTVEIVEEEKKGMEKELQVYISRLLDPNYIIGSESFTFSYSDSLSRIDSLEYVLTAFASNSHVVKKFFALSSETEPHKLENLISTVLVQMLIGAKNISLDNLNFHLRKCGLDQKDEMFFNKFYKLLLFLSNSLSPELMPITRFKRIVYSELETDEPIDIREGLTSGIPVFESWDCLIPRPGIISGLFIDTISIQKRVRNVLNSSGLIFPVIINRFDSDKKLIENDIVSNIIDYAVIGGALFDENGFYSEFCSTHTENSSLKFSHKTGGAFNYHQNNEDFIQYFVKLKETIREKSLVFFVVKKSCWIVNSIGAKEIPLFLAENALNNIQESIFRPLQSKKKVRGTVRQGAIQLKTDQKIAARPITVQSKAVRQKAAQQTTIVKQTKGL